MTNRQTPPGLTSILNVVVMNPRGPHHCAMCCGSVQTLKISSRGALKMRVATISRSPTSCARPPVSVASDVSDAGARRAAGSAFSLTGFVLLLKFLEVLVEAVEALVPKAAVVLDPVRDLLERP